MKDTLLVVYGSIFGVSAALFIVAALFGEFFDLLDGMFDFIDFGGGSAAMGVRSLLLFTMGFGGAGAIAAYYNQDTMMTAIAGVAAGAFLGGVGYEAMKALYAQQSTSPLTSTGSLVGKEAIVTITVESNKAGEVAVVDNRGVAIRMTAYSALKREVGESVMIKSVVGDTVLVDNVA